MISWDKLSMTKTQEIVCFLSASWTKELCGSTNGLENNQDISVLL